MGLVEGGRRGQMVRVRVNEDVAQEHKTLPPSPLLTFEVLIGLVGCGTISLAHAYVDSVLLYI